jgi:hypothetical protein
MDEGIQIPVLQFEGKVKFRILAANRSELSNDPQTMADVAHMVISHFKYY